MYEECLSCNKLGVSCDGPNFVAMNAHELLEWCKIRKHHLGLSNAKLADLSNMPKGTIDRLFAGEHTDFKYETMRPLVRALVGGKFDDNPCPAPAEFARAEEIEQENIRLKEMIKNNEAEHHKAMGDLKAEHREDTIFLRSQIQGKNFAIVALAATLVVTFSAIIGFMIYDRINPEVGFFWREDKIETEYYKEETNDVLPTGK